MIGVVIFIVFLLLICAFVGKRALELMALVLIGWGYYFYSIYSEAMTEDDFVNMFLILIIGLVLAFVIGKIWQKSDANAVKKNKEFEKNLIKIKQEQLKSKKQDLLTKIYENDANAKVELAKIYVSEAIKEENWEKIKDAENLLKDLGNEQWEYIELGKMYEKLSNFTFAQHRIGKGNLLLKACEYYSQIIVNVYIYKTAMIYYELYKKYDEYFSIKQKYYDNDEDCKEKFLDEALYNFKRVLDYENSKAMIVRIEMDKKREY